MDLSFLRSLAIASRIAVSALKEATLGDIKGRNSFQATELSRSQDLALSLLRNNLTGFQSTILLFALPKLTAKPWKLGEAAVSGPAPSA